MKVAYLMNGVVGGLSGKNFQRTNDEIAHLILEYCAKTHNHLQNENVEIDYFIYSWEPYLDEHYKRLFNPKGHQSSEQITFEVAPHYEKVKGHPRVQAHYSRWYGAKKVYEMCDNYASENNFEYDLVVNARIDLCFHNDIDFSNFDTTQFHIATSIQHPNFNWPKNKELIDHIFIGNQINMKNFLNIYDLLTEYTTPGQCPQWNHISSHMLAVWHLNKLGLLNINTIKESLKTHFIKSGGVDYHIFRYQELTEQQLIESLK